MYAEIMKSKNDGQKMTETFYDHDMIPIKTMHFGAEGYDDYTVAPHDEDNKKPDISKDTNLLRIGRIVQQPARSQDICCGTFKLQDLSFPKKG